MKNSNISTAFTISALLMMSSAYAENKQSNLEQNGQWLAGAGVLGRTQAQIGVDSTTYLIPYIAYYGQSFFFEMNDFGYSMVDRQGYQLGLIGSLRFDGYDSGDSPALQGMRPRDHAIDGGVRIVLSGSLGEAEVKGITDLTNTHDGSEISIAFSRPIIFHKTMIKPSLAVRWKSKKLMNYYYGVATDEVRSGRAAYNPDASLSWVTELDVMHGLSKHLSVVVNLAYEQLGTEYTDSPIIEDDYVITMFGGLIYRF
ncbi:MAG: MipA/OmpV family protein [Gammaproteobacteria bacterium]